MTLKYGNLEAIAKLLRGRLQVSSATVTTVPLAGQLVDPETIQIVGEEEESFIDMVLAQVYEMPLQLSSPVTVSYLRNIADNLIIGRILEIHFQGQQIANLGQDATGFGPAYRKRGMDLLQALTVGHNVFIPGQPPIAGTLPGTTPQPVVLPGEKKATHQPDTITRSYTFIGTKKNNLNTIGIQWNGMRSNGRALGSEDPLKYPPRNC